MVKNECGKTVSKPFKDNAYEVWENESAGFRWYILKKYQIDDNKQYARAFCLVTSPYVGETGELGDVYIADIHSNAVRIK